MKKYTEMTKEFKHSCTLILSKKSPKELEALEKEQIGIVQQLREEIDNFLVSVSLLSSTTTYHDFLYHVNVPCYSFEDLIL